MSISNGFKKGLILFITLLLQGFAFNTYAQDEIKKIKINTHRVYLEKDYALYLSGICKDQNGRYGLIQFTQSTDHVISTQECVPQASKKSSDPGFFAIIERPEDGYQSKDKKVDTFLSITTPIKSARFYFYIAKVGSHSDKLETPVAGTESPVKVEKDNAPSWTIFSTTKPDTSGNFGLQQPNIKELLSKGEPIYPTGIIEITKDAPIKGRDDTTYYADGTLIDGVSPLFATIIKQSGQETIVSGYTIPEGMDTTNIIDTIIAKCNGDGDVPAKELCKSFLTVDKKDKLDNAWLIAPTEIPPANFSKKLSDNTLNYLKLLDNKPWVKSTYCGTFHVGDGSDANCPEGTLCSTLGQYKNNVCYDQYDADKPAHQFSIVFSSSRSPNEKDPEACILKLADDADPADGKYWMTSPCWDLRTVYSPAMPAASNDCEKWPGYKDLADNDKFLATGVQVSLTPEQQKDENRGQCGIKKDGTPEGGTCPYSMMDCTQYIDSFQGNFDNPDCVIADDPPRYVFCRCPITYTQKFDTSDPKISLCHNPESINAITSWVSVLLAATPDLNGENGLFKACKHHVVVADEPNGDGVLLTPECLAEFITSPKSTEIKNTTTNYFGEHYYAWLLQFLYVKDGKLVFPQFDAAANTTTVTDTNKSDYLSGFGPTYVFPFSDFVSGDKALLTWGDKDINDNIEIDLMYKGPTEENK